MTAHAGRLLPMAVWLSIAVSPTAGALAQAQEQEREQVTTPPAAGSEVPVDTVVLQGLDKITARISTFVAPFNEPVRFGSLEITARTCHRTPPEEPPERSAFLEIVDVRPDSPAVPLFTGWMFASSPALSSLEHPVYDVWVKDCQLGSELDSTVSPAASDAAESQESPEGDLDSAAPGED